MKAQACLRELRRGIDNGPLNIFSVERIIDEVRRQNDYMPNDERQRLAGLLRTKRETLGLSSREVAVRAGVDSGTVSLLENCKIGKPGADTLREIARVLDIPMIDIYTAVRWLQPGELPSLQPYMRAKYADLPNAALAEVEQYVEFVLQRHRAGPLDGEDENPELEDKRKEV